MQLLPSVEHGQVFFGAVRYEPGGPEEECIDWTVAGAPVALWLGLAAPTLAGRVAVSALFQLPLVDVSMSLVGRFEALPDADLCRALAGHGASLAVVALALPALHVELGPRLFGRVWPAQLSALEERLGLPALLPVPWIRR